MLDAERSVSLLILLTRALNRGSSKTIFLKFSWSSKLPLELLLDLEGEEVRRQPTSLRTESLFKSETGSRFEVVDASRGF